MMRVQCVALFARQDAIGGGKLLSFVGFSLCMGRAASRRGDARIFDGSTFDFTWLSPLCTALERNRPAVPKGCGEDAPDSDAEFRTGWRGACWPRREQRLPPGDG